MGALLVAGMEGQQAWARIDGLEKVLPPRAASAPWALETDHVSPVGVAHATISGPDCAGHTPYPASLLLGHDWIGTVSRLSAVDTHLAERGLSNTWMPPARCRIVALEGR